MNECGCDECEGGNLIRLKTDALAAIIEAARMANNLHFDLNLSAALERYDGLAKASKENQK